MPDRRSCFRNGASSGIGFMTSFLSVGFGLRSEEAQSVSGETGAAGVGLGALGGNELGLLIEALGEDLLDGAVEEAAVVERPRTCRLQACRAVLLAQAQN